MGAVLLLAHRPPATLISITLHTWGAGDSSAPTRGEEAWDGISGMTHGQELGVQRGGPFPPPSPRTQGGENAGAF
jgi:hypothetical protein